MPTVSQVFREERENFGSIPSVENDWVCNACLGPCNPEFGRLCRGCEILYELKGAPAGLQRMAVPMTSVLERGRWYHALLNYKSGMPDEYMPILISLTRTYFDRQQDPVADLLGGPPTAVTLVPSKRGDDFESQPLRTVVEYVLYLRENHDLLEHTLRFTGDQGDDYRQEYFPEAFEEGPVDVDGERVLLVEDAWVTGATAVSAAGAMLEHGADSVAILPMARIVDQSFWPEEHPYRDAMVREYDPSTWPR